MFTVIQHTHSLYYQLSNPSELKRVEISDDLSEARFYYADTVPETLNHDYDRKIALARRRGLVNSIVCPPQGAHYPFDGFRMGSTGGQYASLSRLKDYASMNDDDISRLKKMTCIDEQLHPLEWALIKARHLGVLTNELYQQIRIDVRHRARQLHEIEIQNKDIKPEKDVVLSPAILPPFTSIEEGEVDWSGESEKKVTFKKCKPKAVYLIKGGRNLEAREKKARQIARHMFFCTHGLHDSKDGSEIAVVSSGDTDTPNHINFATSKKITAGKKRLYSSFIPNYFEKDTCGVINLSDTDETVDRYNKLVRVLDNINDKDKQTARGFYKAKRLLTHYTRNGSLLSRFFHGEWRHHHIDAISNLIQKIDRGEITKTQALIAALDKIKLSNKNGQLAKSFHLIKEIYEAEISLPKEAISSFISM